MEPEELAAKLILVIKRRISSTPSRNVILHNWLSELTIRGNDGGLPFGGTLRGEYDVAVFQAMKTVETSIREAAGYGAGDYGTDMIGRAFNVATGPLTDPDAPIGERKALASLMVGSYGSYRNPHSHHDIDLKDPVEAMVIVLLANHLLRIIDARKAARVS